MGRLTVVVGCDGGPPPARMEAGQLPWRGWRGWVLACSDGSGRRAVLLARSREATVKKSGGESGFGSSGALYLMLNGWEAREFPIERLADLTALGLAGDVDPLPGLDIGQDSLGKDIRYAPVVSPLCGPAAASTHAGARPRS
jgi:hypothetical protein